MNELTCIQYTSLYAGCSKINVKPFKTPETIEAPTHEVKRLSLMVLKGQPIRDIAREEFIRQKYEETAQIIEEKQKENQKRELWLFLFNSNTNISSDLKA